MLRVPTPCAALVLALAIAATPSARAAHQTILGDRLTVKNPSTPDERWVMATAREIASSATIVGDPSVAGASLTIAMYGDTPSSQTFSLPGGASPSTGKPFWNGDAVRGFKYTDSKGENGPVRAVQVQTSRDVFKVKAIAVGRRGNIAVVPPNLDTDGCVRLEVGGGGDTYDIRFGADGLVTNNGAREFKVAKPKTEAICAPPSPTSTIPQPTCANGGIHPPSDCGDPAAGCVCRGSCGFGQTCFQGLSPSRGCGTDGDCPPEAPLCWHGFGFEICDSLCVTPCLE